MSKPLKCRRDCRWFGTRACPDYKKSSFTFCSLFSDKRKKDDANGYVDYWGERVKL